MGAEKDAYEAWMRLFACDDPYWEVPTRYMDRSRVGPQEKKLDRFERRYPKCIDDLFIGVPTYYGVLCVTRNDPPDAIKEAYERKKKHSTYPDEVIERAYEMLTDDKKRRDYKVVALGAAVATLREGVKETPGKIRRPVEISDVISRSLGVLVVDGTVSKIITRNTKIPISRTQLYTNPRDYQDEASIEVYQGESLYPEEDGYLGEFWIDLEPKPAGESKIDISFTVGEEFGILHVTAKDHDSGNERTVKMEAVGRLTKEEKSEWMDKMLKMHAIKVRVENIDTRDVLSYALNPNARIGDVRDDLMRKGMLSEGMGIFYKDNELDDASLVKDAGIKSGSGLELRQKK
mgnify:CR=1 FL=1